MNYSKVLFIRLFIAMLTTLILVSISTYSYMLVSIEGDIKEKALHASNSLSSKYIDMQHSQTNIMGNTFKQNIIKNTNFHFFNITDKAGKNIFYETSSSYNLIKEQIKNSEHKINLHNDEHSTITITHNHNNDIYYLDVVIPWQISQENIGKLHTFYDASEYVKSIYKEWFQDIILSVIIMGLFFIAGFPTVLILNKSIVKKNKSLSKTNIDILNLLGSAIAKRDSDTNAHNFRVTMYALILGEHLKLNKQKLKSLIKGSFLHDVGKIGISDAILLKPGKLTDPEFEVMKQHVLIGAEIINHSEQLNDAREIVFYHHEKYDGTGYMHGLKAENIPINARIFAIADVFDALTSKRPYKEPFSYEKAFEIMNENSGTHFDPKLLETFFQIAPDLFAQINSYNSENELKSALNEKISQYFD